MSVYVDRSGSQDIYLLSIASGSLVHLTEGTARDLNPQWSRDGSMIVFYRELDDHRDQIYTIGSDGAQETQETDGTGNNFFPAFGPNNEIIFARQEEQEPASLVSMFRGGPMRLLLGRPSFFGRIAPSGDRVAFISGSWPHSSIRVARLDGSHETIIAGDS